MNKTIYLEPNMVPAVLRGSYNGKKFKAVIVDSVTIPADAGLWSGGYRDTYDAIGIDGQSKRLSDHYHAPWDNTRKEQKVTLAPGLIVRRFSNMGMSSDVTFFLHAQDAVKLLPPPAPDLTQAEKNVLEATKTYKSSYNGKDRFQMWNGHQGYSRNQDKMLTRTQWDEAKASLITKGLLNKSGAITVAGRNAI